MNRYDRIHAFYRAQPSFVDMWNSTHPSWGGTYLDYWAARVDAMVRRLAASYTPPPLHAPPPPNTPAFARACLTHVSGPDYRWALYAFLKTFPTPASFEQRFAPTQAERQVPGYTYNVTDIGFAGPYDGYIAMHAASYFVAYECHKATSSGMTSGPSVPAECWDVPGFKDLHDQALAEAQRDAAAWYYNQDSGVDESAGICQPGMAQAACEEALFDAYLGNLVNFTCSPEDIVGTADGGGAVGPGVPPGTPCTSANNIMAAQSALRQFDANLAIDGIWGPKSAAALSASGLAFEDLVAGCTPPVPSYSSGGGAAVQPKDGKKTGGGGTELVTVKTDKKDEGSNTWLWILAGTAAAAGVGLLIYNAQKREEPAYEHNPTRQSPLRQVPYNVIDRFDRRQFNPHTNLIVRYKGHPIELLYRGGRNFSVYSQGQYFYVLSIDQHLPAVYLAEYNMDAELVDAYEMHEHGVKVMPPWAEASFQEWQVEDVLGKHWMSATGPSIIRKLIDHLGDYIG